MVSGRKPKDSSRYAFLFFEVAFINFIIYITLFPFTHDILYFFYYLNDTGDSDQSSVEETMEVRKVLKKLFKCF